MGREDRRLDIKGAYRCVTVRQCVECVSCEESISRNELPSIFETYPTYRVSYKRCHRGVRMSVPRAKTTCPLRKVARCYDWIRRVIGVHRPIGRIRTRIPRSARPIFSRRAPSCWRPATSSASKKLPLFARRWIFGKMKEEDSFFFFKILHIIMIFIIIRVFACRYLILFNLFVGFFLVSLKRFNAKIIFGLFFKSF